MRGDFQHASNGWLPWFSTVRLKSISKPQREHVCLFRHAHTHTRTHAHTHTRTYAHTNTQTHKHTTFNRCSLH